MQNVWRNGRDSVGRQLALFSLLCLGVTTEASGGGAASFADFARRSETILAGTVERAWVEMDRRVHVLVVRVDIREIRTVKGWKKDRLLLSVWLGEGDGASPHRGKTPQEVGFPPEFRKGARYIFMISKSPDSETAGYTQIIALNGGLFPVLHDPSRRKSFVHDFASRPVARIERDHLVVVDATSDASTAATPRASPSGKTLSSGFPIEVLPIAEDPGSRLSEETFLRVVGELLSGQPGGGASTVH